jgi:hypothetical protein
MGESEGGTMTEKESAVENCCQVNTGPESISVEDKCQPEDITVSSQMAVGPKETFRHIKNLSFELETPTSCDEKLHVSTLLDGKKCHNWCYLMLLSV